MRSVSKLTSVDIRKVKFLYVWSMFNSFWIFESNKICLRHCSILASSNNKFLIYAIVLMSHKQLNVQLRNNVEIEHSTLLICLPLLSILAEAYPLTVFSLIIRHYSELCFLWWKMIYKVIFGSKLAIILSILMLLQYVILLYFMIFFSFPD